MFAVDENSACAKSIALLKSFCDSHRFWSNPLLKACEEGSLTFSDFQFIFSQYYLYCKNFTRFIAGLMANCESDYYRSKLSENLWEEGGGADSEQRHAEIFRNFLKDHLKIASLDAIVFEPFTEEFVQRYLNICLRYKPLEVAAALSLGTEGIVARLYQIFRKGFLRVGLKEEALLFFNIHIACDDDHALTLEEIMRSYANEPNWFERSQAAIDQVLNLRDCFFLAIYKHLKFDRLNQLIDHASRPIINPSLPNKDILKNNIHYTGNRLYQNNHENIQFSVERLPFNAEVLDPRLVFIPPNRTNEYHSHAHETIFLILSGEGTVAIENQSISVKAGDVVFVPRWLKHQTRNSGKEELRFFAITDYGFTKCFPANSESVYRLNKMNSIQK